MCSNQATHCPQKTKGGVCFWAHMFPCTVGSYALLSVCLLSVRLDFTKSQTRKKPSLIVGGAHFHQTSLSRRKVPPAPPPRSLMVDPLDILFKKKQVGSHQHQVASFPLYPTLRNNGFWLTDWTKWSLHKSVIRGINWVSPNHLYSRS